MVSLAEETLAKTLSQRGRMRASAAFVFAVSKINENLETGLPLRTDDFFEDLPGRRSGAAEIADGVLLAAQREYEEEKLRAYGRLLGNLAFKEGYSRAHCNTLLRLGERLSYRQLCLIAVFRQDRPAERFSANTLALRNDIESLGICHELLEMARMELLWRTDNNLIMDIHDLIPSLLVCRRLAYPIYHLMELWDDGVATDTKKLASLMR